MRKRKFQAIAGIGIVVGLTAAGVVPAAAVSISNLQGQSCGGDIGTWHFVNNQIPSGSGVGTLIATFTGGQTVSDLGEVKGKGATQHFYVTASGTLLSASTSLGGRLVLSDFSCDGGKKGESDK